jgi:acyl-coenzyme A thioesterase PaaI-like protein
VTAQAPFSAVSTVRRLGERAFEATVDPRWTVAGKPNGGYLLALAARAAAEVSGRADVLSAQAVYLHAPDPGEVAIEAELLRAGRSAAHVRVRIAQGPTACVESLIMTTELPDEQDVEWEAGVPALEVAPIGECVRLPAIARDGTGLDVLGQNDLRLDPASAGWLERNPSGRGEVRGWLALGGGEPFDSFSLLYAVDALPPATFDIRPTGWVPTLQLSATVRGRPRPGPVALAQRAGLVADGRVDEACWVWDGAGRLVAQATQLAVVRLDRARRPGAGDKDGGARRQP